MTLREMSQSRLMLDFEYWNGGTLSARGAQGIACMRKRNGVMEPGAWLEELRQALG